MPDTKVVCELTGDKIKRVRLARTPNYHYSMPDPLDYWPVWTKKEAFNQETKELWLSDSIHLTQKDPKYYEGGTVWGQDDNVVMNTVLGQRITAWDPAKHRIAVGARRFGGRGCPYYIENTPFLLDTVSEYYWDNKARRMFIRLDQDKDPNTTTLEVATKGSLINIEGKHDIVVSGLSFGFTTNDINRIKDDDESIAVVHLRGTCSNIEVSHNKFTYVSSAFSAKNPGDGELRSHDLLVSDNDIYVADDQAIGFYEGGKYFFDKVKIMRNRIYDNGARHLGPYGSSIPAIYGALLDGEIAGNIIDVSWGNGISIFWGKMYKDSTTSLPFIRGFYHHNKATNTLLGCNDYGGIESWQGGPVFIYDNISHNASGWKRWEKSSIGYAFYIDGGFKHYSFNNIASGLSWQHNRSGFMTVLGFYNMTVHNTGYNMMSFSHGAVNDLDSDGHNAYLSNLGDSVYFMFKTSMKPENAAFESIGKNVASKTPFRANLITVDSLKRRFWHYDYEVDFNAYKKEVQSFNPQLGTVGIEAKEPVLPYAYNHDFRPAHGSAAIDMGVKFFIAFPLYENVGEWNFYKHPADSSVIMADNFYMSDDYKHRNTYIDVAHNNLKAHGVTLKSFVKGYLEDWTEGALNFDGKQTYCSLDNDSTSIKKCTNVNMDTNNFIIEVFFKTEKGHKDGVLVSKYDPSGNGYKLDIDKNGKPRLSFIVSGNPVYSESGAVALNDGKWHHLLAEVYRSGETNIYIDGVLRNGRSLGKYPDASLSLSNKEDLLVGKSPEGNFFKGTIDFLRLSRGTLKDARTTIAELYKWELDGPFLRDFTGILPLGKARDAGAIEVE